MASEFAFNNTPPVLPFLVVVTTDDPTAGWVLL